MLILGKSFGVYLHREQEAVGHFCVLIVVTYLGNTLCHLKQFLDKDFRACSHPCLHQTS